jgi:DNA-binding transcriptional MocR family regulator
MDETPKTTKKELEVLPQKGYWVQTERATHEAWAVLTKKSPKAAQLLHILTSRVGEHNAVVISQHALKELMGCSRATLQRSIKALKDDNWIEVRQIGGSGTTNAYVLNSRVAWSGKRDSIRYALLNAAVIVSEEEQPDKEELGQQPSLRQIPTMSQEEIQLPSGDGLEPPSEPQFPGLEMDIPSIR